VQVESLAQLGVQLLLFGLGLELSLHKLRAVWGVSIIGGLLQILLLMLLGGITAAVAHASVSMGIFVGGLPLPLPLPPAASRHGPCPPAASAQGRQQPRVGSW
jgi:predicted Kef-type K+ transport protein